MATLKQSLTVPETGWRRYDDSDSRFSWGGTNRINIVSASSYGGSYGATNTPVTIKFYGTKFRIIGTLNNDRATSLPISIDGVSDTPYSEYGPSALYQALLYEKTGLSLGVHTVRINIQSGYNIYLDAIDIDSTGYLVHPTLNQVSDINTMAIGDVIPCRYTALTSGVAGYFSELGTCIKDEIPVAGSATPDGLFYLIKTDKGTLIADRVIQTNISWDVLNSAKYIENKNYTFDLMYKSNITPPNDGWTEEYAATSGTKSLQSDGSIYLASYTGAYAVYKKVNVVNKDNTIVIETKLKLPSNISFANIEDGSKRLMGGINASGQLTVNGNVVSTTGIDLQATHVYKLIKYGQIKWEIYVDDIKLLEGTNWATTTLNAIWFGNSSGINGGYSLYYFYCNLSNRSGGLLNSIIRSLSGGCAYADANGNKSLTNASKGAWPTNNEWDKYIVNSDLKGKMTKGDDNIWHYKSSHLCSWVKETPINGTWNDGLGHTGASSNVYRINRGYFSDGTWQDVNFGTSSVANVNFGFRPVLNYVESDIQSEVI